MAFRSGSQTPTKGLLPAMPEVSVAGWSTPKHRDRANTSDTEDSAHLSKQGSSISDKFPTTGPAARYARRSTFETAFAADPSDSKHDTEPLKFDERGLFSFFTNLFRYRGTVYGAIWPQLLCVVILAVVVAIWEDIGPFRVGISTTAHVILGSLLSLLLVFRNNISHSRYNEARLLLSSVKTGMRTIALMVHTTAHGLNPDSPAADRALFLQDAKELVKQLQLLFASMVDDVRDTREEQPDQAKARPAPFPNVMPVKVSFRRMTQRIIESRRTDNGALMYRNYPAHLRPVIVAGQVQRLLHEMSMQEYGSCSVPAYTAKYCSRLLHGEVMKSWTDLVRIVTSPAPFLYRHLLNSLTFLFVFTLPFSLVEEFGYVTIPAALIMATAYYSVLALAHELENPLGWDVNDIDLDGFQSLLSEELVTLHAHTFGLHPKQAADQLSGNTMLPKKANIFAHSVLDAMSSKKGGRAPGGGARSGGIHSGMAASLPGTPTGVGTGLTLSSSSPLNGGTGPKASSPLRTVAAHHSAPVTPSPVEEETPTEIGVTEDGMKVQAIGDSPWPSLSPDPSRNASPEVLNRPVLPSLDTDLVSI